MVDYQTIGVLIAAASVVIGVVNSILVSRREEKRQELMLKNQEITLETRQAQMYMRIYEKITDEEMFRKLFELNEYRWDDYEDYLEKYSGDIHVRAKRISVVGFFEGMGMLVKRGLIDPVFVADSIGSHVVNYWNKFGTVVEEGRRRSGNKLAQENIEYLYDEILRIWEQHPEGFIPLPE